MNYSSYEIFKNFQTLIVGILGFSGVMFTLYTNARIGREQVKNSIAHERGTLKTALSAELGLILAYFYELAKTSDANGEKTSAFYPEEISQLVYRSFITKIGLLSSEQAAAVIKAYSLINELTIRLKLLSAGHDPSFNKQGYIFISEEHEETALSIYRNFIPIIEQAIEALKK